MDTQALNYSNFSELLKRYENNGRRDSANFLAWFLENIYRLDPTAAADAICDESNDKGIDGIYVDHNAEELHFFQSKISQKESSIGDREIKGFMGSVAQFQTDEQIKKILAGSANEDLKKLLLRNEIGTLLARGYTIKAAFIANCERDANTVEVAQHFPDLIVFSASDIVSNFIEFDANEGVKETFDFDASYAGMLELKVTDTTQVYFLPVSATTLVKLSGISDGKLFSQNVRYSLGNTPVNKAISKSVANSLEHKNFALYHNGVTLICRSAEFIKEQEFLRVRDYVVVNGAQSITTFFHNASRLSPDLRVFVKIIALKSEELARKITVNSNNQNSIKPRDLRSNHDIMLRLRAEFESAHCGYQFEIKRGQPNESDLPIISNEEAGRELLAFDLNEPYSCHQIYRVFDDKYAEIFGRREVTFGRIVFLRELMELIAAGLAELEHRPLASYALTKHFLLNCVGHVIRLFDEGRTFLSDNDRMNSAEDRFSIMAICEEVVSAMIIDLNYEVKSAGLTFDYKKELKSPDSVKEWRLKLLRTYEKDFKRGKISGFGDSINRSVE